MGYPKDHETVWAWAFDWPNGYCSPAGDMKPTMGVLVKGFDGLPSKPVRNPDRDRFVPCPEGAGNPDWSRATGLDGLNLAETKDAAEAAYGAAVRSAIARFMGLARAAQDCLAKRPQDGYSEDGYLDDWPIFAVDLSGDMDAVREALMSDLVLRPDHGGMVMPWEEFMGHVEAGAITDRDGGGDVLVDGYVSSNCSMSISMGMLYIYDKFLVPFERVPQVFEGRDLQVAWFGK